MLRQVRGGNSGGYRPALPLRFRFSHMPSGTRTRPAKNGAGSTIKTKIPIYGLVVSPRSVTGRRNSQNTVAVVTRITPARLIQLFDR